MILDRLQRPVSRCVAVVPARRAERTIAAALESLRIANASFVDRVLVVTSAADPTADVVRAWARHDPGVELVLADHPRSAGAARNDGRRAAIEGAEEIPLLLFMDADCRLQAGGARELAEELTREGAAAVSARVLSSSGGLVARCRHILEFKEASSRREPPRAWLPPSTTLMCRAAAFDHAGGFPDQWPGEDLVFSQTLRDQGDNVRRSRRVVTRHAHPPGLGTMLRHQVRLGRTAALARRSLDMPGSVLARHAWLAPLLFPARALRIAAWQAKEGPVVFGRTLLFSPFLVAGLLAWTAGFVVGARAPQRSLSRSARPLRPARRDEPEGPRPSRSRRAVAVVPAFDGERHLRACLEALLGSEASLKVVVVDDASRDSTLALARRVASEPAAQGRVHVIALGRNEGFAAAVNRGVAWALGQCEPAEDLILVNQDCFVSPGWLAPLQDALSEPDVALAGARLLEVDGVTVQHDGARVEPNGLTSHLGRGEPARSAAPATLTDVDYVCGAVLALRASTWERLGSLDEGYGPAYFEDVDYCVRARRQGLRVVVAPESQARHVEASTSGRGSSEYLRRYHRSRLRFVVRHHASDVGWGGWLRSEAAWLAGLRTWREIAPVLAAYASSPRFLLEGGGTRRLGRTNGRQRELRRVRGAEVAKAVRATRAAEALR